MAGREDNGMGGEKMSDNDMEPPEERIDLWNDFRNRWRKSVLPLERLHAQGGKGMNIGEKRQEIMVAISEARRFVERCNALIADMDADRGDDNSWYWGWKHNAAVKRASMDLSRALVALRR